MAPRGGLGSNQAVMEQRLAKVSEWLIEGHPQNTIYKMAKEEWDITTRQTMNYIKRCRQRFVESAQMRRDELVATTLEQLDHLLTESTRRGQLSAALGCINTRLRMLGIDAPK